MKSSQYRFIVTFISTFILLSFLLPLQLNAVVYEASTLHNSVARSDTVQELFLGRWDIIVEESLYLDLYCRINWLKGFQVNAYNRGTGETQATDMTLVRTYGSIALTFPILGDSYFDEIKSRFSCERESKIDPEDEGTGIAKYWSKDNLLIGISTAGFHYGLTRKVEVDRGNAGDETATDYKFSQFFDDIYAVSVLYVPYLYVHSGIVVNNQIEPDDSGTIDYNDSSNRDIRYFFASNIFSFLNTNLVLAEREAEVIAFSVNINRSIGFLYGVPELLPEFTIGYKQINIYSDEPYDPVWVGSYYINGTSRIKDSNMSDEEKDNARLYLVPLSIDKSLKNILDVNYSMELQRTSQSLIDKRTLEKINITPVKEMHAIAGLNLLGFTKARLHKFTLTGGWSRYWDPAIALHRESGTGYWINGWIFKVEYSMPLGGFHFMVNKNYSEELRKLTEASDKLAIEGSLYFRI